MKYPNEIVSIVRKKTLSVDAHLFKKTDDKPMEIFDSKFSRFVLNVIADGRAVFTNIPIDSLAGMRAKTDFAMREHLNNITSQPAMETQAAGVDTDRPAFRLHFLTGSLKGKTPGEVMLHEADAVNILNGQYQWLASHLAQYPKNQSLMDAITDALNITTDGNAAAPAPETKSFVLPILEIGARPLTRRSREDGKCLTYQASIVWDDSQNYPVTVTVANYYAPVVKRENGLLNVLWSQRDTATEIKNTFVMTAEEWLNALDTMEKTKESFRLVNFVPAFNAASNAEREARAAYRQNNPVNTAPQPVSVQAQRPVQQISQPAASAPVQNVQAAQPVRPVQTTSAVNNTVQSAADNVPVRQTAPQQAPVNVRPVQPAPQPSYVQKLPDDAVVGQAPAAQTAQTAGAVPQPQVSSPVQPSQAATSQQFDDAPLDMSEIEFE